MNLNFISLAILKIRLFYKFAISVFFVDYFTNFAMSTIFRFVFFDYSSVSRETVVLNFKVVYGLGILKVLEVAGYKLVYARAEQKCKFEYFIHRRSV